MRGEIGVGCIKRKRNEEPLRGWDAKFKMFEKFDGMPKHGTELYNWKRNQMSGSRQGLKATIINESKL